MERYVILMMLVIAYVPNMMVAATFQDEIEQGKMLLARFVGTDAEFEGHDIAFIAHDYGEGRFRRSTNEDIDRLSGNCDKNIRLDMTSGESLNLTLRHVPIISSETEVFYNTHEGRVKRSGGPVESCYANGQVEGGGIAAISFCDGIFGLVSSGDYDYFVQPVMNSNSPTRYRRDVTAHHKVHVLWRRSTPWSSLLHDDSLSDVYTNELHNDIHLTRRSAPDYPEGTKLVIELAMFHDAAYCKRLEERYPGREDQFLLTRMAAAQAIYGDIEKVGYDFQIKVKLIEYWTVDPEEYDFQEDLNNNLGSFCEYTRNRYNYDLVGLNSGITNQEGRTVGLAVLNGACRRKNCFIALQIGPNSFGVLAHEIGHNLNFQHPGQSACPEDLNRNASFMGAGIDFSECDKWQLKQFIESDGSSCLFEETHRRKTPKSYLNLPNAFPGQWKSPNELCELYSGAGFVYYPPGPPIGKQVCNRWFCLNDDNTSPSYGKLDPQPVPAGFPCGHHLFCRDERRCMPLETPNIGWDIDKIKAAEGDTRWSRHSKTWTPCSKECGTGVSLRSRECKKTVMNLRPFCEGLAFKAKLCNTQPCPEHESLQTQADNICNTFLQNGVKLSLNEMYLPKAEILGKNSGKLLAGLNSSSCLLRCLRAPDDRGSMPDAILPDGSICDEGLRSDVDIFLMGIEYRCVRGHCIEFSECSAGQYKDECGICDGDGSRCVTKLIDSSYDVEKGQRSVLAVIPAGSRYIDVDMKWHKNRGVMLELWSKNDECIIGDTGLYINDVYEGDEAVKFSSAFWFFERKKAYLRSPGPIRKDVVIKALRGQLPITEITIRYTKSSK